MLTCSFTWICWGVFCSPLGSLVLNPSVLSFCNLAGAVGIYKHSWWVSASKLSNLLSPHTSPRRKPYWVYVENPHIPPNSGSLMGLWLCSRCGTRWNNHKCSLFLTRFCEQIHKTLMIVLWIWSWVCIVDRDKHNLNPDWMYTSLNYFVLYGLIFSFFGLRPIVSKPHYFVTTKEEKNPILNIHTHTHIKICVHTL